MNDARDVPKDPYVRQFWNKCRTKEALGSVATALRGIHPGLYRVSVGAEPRAVLWHDQEADVVWLCAGLSFPDGDPRHAALYAEVQRLLANDLLPTAAEVKSARAERFWFEVVDELAYTLRRAEQQTGVWFDANIETPSGTTVRYARFLVEAEPVPGEGTMLLRYVVVLRKPPESIPHPPYWQAAMVAELFPDGNLELLSYSERPQGAEIREQDTIFVHEAEEYDEELADEA